MVSRPAVPPANVRARQIVLLPFRNVTRAPANDWLVTGAPLILGEILAQYRDLRVVPEPSLTAARRRLGISSDVVPDQSQRRRLAEETAGWTSVSGNILATGKTVRISAESFDAASAQVTARASAEVPAGSDIREAFDRLAIQLLAPAGVAPPPTKTDVVALTTRSIDAYRSYTEGIAFMQRGAYKRAEMAFREAVRLDPNFALAWVKLGIVAIQVGGLADYINPFGNAAQAVERAARASSYLPPRTAAGVRAVQHLFHGEVERSHAIADSLVATDPDDIDAHEWLSIVHFFDSRLDPVTGQRLGSLTRSIEESKWVIEHDPGRQEVLVVPATIYGMGAGFMGGVAGGRRKPVTSLAAELITPADVGYIVTIDDSVVLVPDSVYRKWTKEQRAAATQRAIAAGRAWIQRWMIASPADAEAHMWASRLEELAGDYGKSLVEYDRAAALGAESAFENPRARRLFLYEMTGQFSAAERITDSIIAAGTLRNRPFNSWMDRSRVVVPSVLLRAKRWSDLMTIAPALDSTMSPCFAVELAMTNSNVTIPAPTLRALADTAANHFLDIWRSPAGRCAGDWSWGFGSPVDYPQRPAAGRKLLAAAESLFASHDSAGVYVAARVAALVDTARRGEIRRMTSVESVATAMEVGSRFTDGQAIVEGDSLTLTMRLVGREPLLLTTRQGIASQSFSFRTLPVAPDSQAVSVNFLRPSRFRDTVAKGSLQDFTTGFQTVVRGATGQFSTEHPAIRASGDVLQVILKGAVVADIRKLHPATARLGAACALSTAGLCTPQTITIQYR